MSRLNLVAWAERNPFAFGKYGYLNLSPLLQHETGSPHYKWPSEEERREMRKTMITISALRRKTGWQIIQLATEKERNVLLFLG